MRGRAQKQNPLPDKSRLFERVRHQQHGQTAFSTQLQRQRLQRLTGGRV